MNWDQLEKTWQNSIEIANALINDSRFIEFRKMKKDIALVFEYINEKIS